MTMMKMLKISNIMVRSCSQNTQINFKAVEIKNEIFFGLIQSTRVYGTDKLYSFEMMIFDDFQLC